MDVFTIISYFIIIIPGILSAGWDDTIVLLSGDNSDDVCKLGTIRKKPTNSKVNSLKEPGEYTCEDYDSYNISIIILPNNVFQSDRKKLRNVKYINCSENYNSNSNWYYREQKSGTIFEIVRGFTAQIDSYSIQKPGRKGRCKLNILENIAGYYLEYNPIRPINYQLIYDDTIEKTDVNSIFENNRTAIIIISAIIAFIITLCCWCIICKCCCNKKRRCNSNLNE